MRRVQGLRVEALKVESALYTRICWDCTILHVCSILFGDTLVPNIEYEYTPFLGYSILYKEYNLTRFHHQKSTTHVPCCKRRALARGLLAFVAGISEGALAA